MPIPQPHDYKIAEAEMLGQSVIALLRGVSWGHARDLKSLRERLQDFASLVMETAHEIVDADVKR
jgi:hypothetical protein